MDGLIPYIFRALKHHNHHKTYRSLSEGSTRSYHQLMNTAASVEGSSHRRTRSEFQPPTLDFLDQRTALELSHSRSLRMNSIFSPSSVNEPSKTIANSSAHPQQVPKPSETNFSNLRHRH